MDHAGTTPYAKSLVDEFATEMKSNLFGNPHSESPSSVLTSQRIEAARAETLKFFRADPEHFDIIFVANATAAIKMVMDGMCGDGRRFWYGYHVDSHTSLIGIREVASAGSTCFQSDQQVEKWLSGEYVPSSWNQEPEATESIGLFAFPGQSNFNGRRLPLTWPGRLQSSDHPCHRQVYSLLDAAALASTTQLDLSNPYMAPDFTALSFYKIFGFPNLGALIVRKEAGHILLRKRYFGGGTVDMVINAVNHPSQAWYARKQMVLHDALEDGTLAFHNIIALGLALRVHNKIYQSMDNVSLYTSSLAKLLYQKLCLLSHENGVALCHIYKDSNTEYGDSKSQGPTIAFNIRNSSGGWIGKSHFEHLGSIYNIQIRTGGVCNPGGVARYLGLSPNDMRHNFAEGLRCGSGIDEIGGKPTGIIRVSLGAMSSMDDIERLINFMHLFIEKPRRIEFSIESASKAHEHPDRLELSEKYHIQQKEIQNFSCPVAACWKVFESESELRNHYSVHRIADLSSASQKFGKASRLAKRIQQALCLR